jgi:NACHT domain
MKTLTWYSSLVVDHLHEKYKDEDVVVVHFYCDYREQQAQTPASCARNMMRQLAIQCNAVPAALSEFYRRTHNEVRDHSWYVELRKIICRVASTFSRCFFVIDALDEAEARSHMAGLLNLLATLRNGIHPHPPKIFATSRKHAYAIQDSFQEAVIVNVTANDEDLRTTLTKMIADHQESKYMMDDELTTEILDKLCANAHGM